MASGVVCQSVYKPELLLEEVRQHRFLYDKYHPQFKDIDRKKNQWEMIGQRFGVSGKPLAFTFFIARVERTSDFFVSATEDYKLRQVGLKRTKTMKNAFLAGDFAMAKFIGLRDRYRKLKKQLLASRTSRFGAKPAPRILWRHYATLDNMLSRVRNGE